MAGASVTHEQIQIIDNKNKSKASVERQSAGEV